MSYKLSPVAYGNYFQTTSVEYTGVTEAQYIYFDETTANGGSPILSGNTRLVAQTGGAYQVNLSAVAHQSTGTNILYNIWFRFNGVDHVNSSREVSVKDSTTTIIIVANGVGRMARDDYMEVMWYGDSANARLYAAVAGTSPTRPVSPAVMMSMIKISD